jgi:N-formylglutamate amidohydrolase
MTDVFSFTRGATPLLISIPHDGRELTPGQAARMTATGRALPDTDWHVRRLYGFVTEMGASVIAANYSRYVVDLNRSADDAALYEGQTSTGLCPEKTFAGDDIYTPGESVSGTELAERVEHYWLPYHDRVQSALDEIRTEFGYALLWDAHSIAAEVPLLFDGVLPDLNVGSNAGRSCRAEFSAAVMQVAAASPFSSVLDGRFRGGYITRHYGDPGSNVHALQLELAQHTYMDENNGNFDADRAHILGRNIREMLAAFTESAQNTP